MFTVHVYVYMYIKNTARPWGSPGLATSVRASQDDNDDDEIMMIMMMMMIAMMMTMTMTMTTMMMMMMCLISFETLRNTK